MEKSIKRYLENKLNIIVKDVKIYNTDGGDYVNPTITFKEPLDDSKYPIFIEKTERFDILKKDLKKVNRNLKIDEILNDKISLEEQIYSKEKLDKLNKLRVEREYNKNLTTTNHIKLDKENSFKLDDRVWFKGNTGIITFVGAINSKGRRKYTIKLQDGNEYRFVTGTDISIRRRRTKNIDLSNNEYFLKDVKRFEKMSTERIIKFKNKNYNKNGYTAALFVLKNREHIDRDDINVSYDRNL